MEKFINEREGKELRLILVGKSGHGKSSVGNSLCAAKVFPTRSSSSSCTKTCPVRDREFEGIELIVCDTPGLFNTKMKLKDIKQEICRSLQTMLSPGLHTFLIVLSAAHRFTEEEQKAIGYINKIFGPNAHKYSDDPLQHLIAQCHHHYIGINNRAGQDERDEKIRQLIIMIQTLLQERELEFLRLAQNEIELQKKEMREEIKKEFQEYFGQHWLEITQQS
ncbi:unnamed protein product, partial [Rotaria sordida]